MARTQFPDGLRFADSTDAASQDLKAAQDKNFALLMQGLDKATPRFAGEPLPTYQELNTILPLHPPGQPPVTPPEPGAPIGQSGFTYPQPPAQRPAPRQPLDIGQALREGVQPIVEAAKGLVAPPTTMEAITAGIPFFGPSIVAGGRLFNLARTAGGIGAEPGGEIARRGLERAGVSGAIPENVPLIGGTSFSAIGGRVAAEVANPTNWIPLGAPEARQAARATGRTLGEVAASEAGGVGKRVAKPSPTTEDAIAKRVAEYKARDAGTSRPSAAMKRIQKQLGVEAPTFTPAQETWLKTDAGYRYRALNELGVKTPERAALEQEFTRLSQPTVPSSPSPPAAAAERAVTPPAAPAATPLVERIRGAYVEAKTPEETLLILPDGSPLASRESRGVGAFQHLTEGLPPIGRWLDAGIIRTGVESDGTRFIEMHGPITAQQGTSLRRFVAGAKNVVMDYTDTPLGRVKSLEGSPDVISRKIQGMSPKAATPPAAAPSVAPAPREAAPPAPPPPAATTGLPRMTPEERAALQSAESERVAREGLPGPRVEGRGPEVPPPSAPPSGPMPPAGAVPPIQPPNDPVKKLTELLTQAKPARAQTLQLQAAERSKRAGAVAGVLRQNKGEAGIGPALGQMKGTFPKATFEPVRPAMTQPEIDSMMNTIANHPDMAPQAKVALQVTLRNVFDGQLPTVGEIAKLEGVFGKDLANALMKHRTFGQKAWSSLVDLYRLPGSLFASMDVSFPGRQGWVLAPSNPKVWAQQWIPMLKAFKSPEFAAQRTALIKANPLYDTMKDAGLDLVEQTGAATPLSKMDENYISRIGNLIPGYAGSNRAFVDFSNGLRWNIAYQKAAEMQRAGVIDPEAYKGLAYVLNAATGRGKLPGGKTLEGLTSILYSPRLQASRLQLVAALVDKNPTARVEAWKALGAFIGTDIAILQAGKMAGLWDVNLDPKSTDFGKGRVYNTRFDIWAGYQQYARFITEMWTGTRTTQAGNVIPANRLETAGRFAESKLYPTLGMAIDYLRGKDYLGRPIDYTPGGIATNVLNHLLPGAAQDEIQAIQDSGPLAGAALGAPSFAGVGVTTIPPTAQDAAAKALGASSFDQLTPEQKIQWRADPAVRAELAKTTTDPIGQFRLDQYEKQTARDQQLTSGVLDWKTWKNALSDAQNASATASDIQNRIRPILEQKAPMNANEKALRDWYDIRSSFEDKKTGIFDAAGWRDAQDKMASMITPEQMDYILNTTGQNVTPQMKFYYDAQRSLKSYYAIGDTLNLSQVEKDVLDKMEYGTPMERIKAAQTPIGKTIDRRITLAREAMRTKDPAIDLAVGALNGGTKFYNPTNIRLAEQGKLTFAGVPVAYTPSASDGGGSLLPSKPRDTGIKMPTPRPRLSFAVPGKSFAKPRR